MNKIVFVHLFNDRSGSPKVLSDVIRVAENRSLDYDLITSSDSDGFLSKYKNNTVCVFYKRSENKLLTLFYYLFSQIHLACICFKYRGERVSFYVNTMMPFSAGIVGKILGCEIIYHIHETSVRPFILKKFLRYVVQHTATKVIYVSKFLKNNELFPGVDSDVIYNAVASIENDKTKDLICLKSCRPIFNVLMVCSLKKYKGVFEFIELAKKFIDIEGYVFTMVLNARDSEISDYMDISQLPKNLVVFPRQNNLYPFYQEASLVLNLSRPDEWIETFGLTILEAMIFGVPVIVPPVGGPAEIVRDDKDGYLISCYNINEIYERILKLRNDEETYKEVALNALSRSLEFDIDSFDRHIIHLLNHGAI